MSTSPYHRNDLRGSLLTAAADLLEQGGPEALSLRELARRVGVSHNAPYRHFPDRGSLLDAVAAEGFLLLTEEMRGVQAASATDRLALLGQKYVEAALQRPGRFALMWSITPAPGFPRTAEAAQGLRDVLGGAIRDLTGAEEQADIVAAWSLVHGMAQLLVQGHLGPSAGAHPADVQQLIGAVTRRFAAALAGSRTSGAP